MSEWEDQSLRDFVSSLGDTAVDLEPINQGTREEEQEASAEATTIKKKRLLVVIGIVILLVLAGAGTIFYLNHNSALTDEYNNTRAEYEQLREDALDKLSEAEMLAEDCRNVIDDRAACEALDEAIRDTEEKSREIEGTSPSQADIDELRKATTELESSLANLDVACERVEEEMSDSLGVYLQELIGEAQQSSTSARALLNQYQGSLENERDGDDLNVLIERLDSTIDEARALLRADSAGTLIDGTRPADARDLTQALRRLMDDISDESATVRQSHQNFLNNQASEAQSQEPTEISNLSPSTSATATEDSDTEERDTASDAPQLSDNGDNN